MLSLLWLTTRTVRYEVAEEGKRTGGGGGGGDWTLVHDGTACGEKLICVNQTCESLYPFIEPGHCETNNNALECSGHGVSIQYETEKASHFNVNFPQG